MKGNIHPFISGLYTGSGRHAEFTLHTVELMFLVRVFVQYVCLCVYAVLECLSIVRSEEHTSELQSR